MGYGALFKPCVFAFLAFCSSRGAVPSVKNPIKIAIFEEVTETRLEKPIKNASKISCFAKMRKTLEAVNQFQTRRKILYAKRTIFGFRGDLFGCDQGICL